MAASWTATATKSSGANRRALLISLVFGAVAAFLVFRLVTASQPASAPVAMVPAVVARQDIPARTVLTDSMVAVKQIPSSVKLATAFNEVKAVNGQIAKVAITSGEQVLSSKVTANERDLGFSGVVPDGMRAISINAAEVTVQGGLLQPGDHIDVIAVFQKADSVPDTGSILVKPDENRPKRYVAATLAQDVPVLAVAQTTTQPGANNSPNKGNPDLKSITLAVAPDVAQKIFLADTAGAIRVSLHRFNDDKPVDISAMNNDVPTVIGDAAPAPISNAVQPVALPTQSGSR